MKNIRLLLLLLVSLASCNRENTEQEEDLSNHRQDTLTAAPVNTDTSFYTSYQNSKFNFALKYPESWKIQQEKQVNPLISIFNGSSAEGNIPGLNSESEMSLISFYPRGLGTELPSGKQRNLDEFNVELPVNFEVDPIKSKVFLLENDQPLGYFLKFHSPPPGWTEDGFIFVNIKVNNFRVRCIGEGKSEKLMDECNPLMGDKVEKYGSVDTEQRSIVRAIMSTINFYRDKEIEKAPISNLINVNQPKPNASVESPLKISGKARGYWYFEASFSVALVTESDKKIAEGVASAKGDWMTEDFVPFEATLEFEAPKAQRGYLVFKRANASGLPENDRSFRIPVIFE